MKEIYLTQGKLALVDDEDYNMLMQYSWCYSIHKRNYYGYASTNIKIMNKSKSIYMHNLIMKPIPENLEVDHIDRNGINNQKYNLRLCTKSQNNQNMIKRQNCSSKYKGVSHRKENNTWRAYIRVDGILKSLGDHYTEIAAAETYDLAAKLYFGEFARLNFPEEVTEV